MGLPRRMAFRDGGSYTASASHSPPASSFSPPSPMSIPRPYLIFLPHAHTHTFKVLAPHPHLQVSTLLVIFLSIALSVGIRRCSSMSSKAWLEPLSTGCMSFAMFIVFLRFPSSSAAAFAYFNCENIDDRRYLKVDLRVDCDGSEHQARASPSVTTG